MRRPLLRDASRISSALVGSGVVGHSISSNPASRASWNRSSTLVEVGSMVNSTALRIGNRPAEAAASGAPARLPRKERRGGGAPETIFPPLRGGHGGGGTPRN